MTIAAVAMFAVAAKYAIDAGTLFYIVVIALIWLGSLIRGVSRAAQRRRAAVSQSPQSPRATTSVPATSAVQASQMPQNAKTLADIRIQLTRNPRAGQRQPPIRIQLNRGPLVSAPAPLSPLRPPTPLSPPEPSKLAQPEVPALELQSAASAFGSAPVAPETPQPDMAEHHAQVLAPLTTPAALVNAIVASAIVGPCAAYRPPEHDPMGW